VICGAFLLVGGRMHFGGAKEVILAPQDKCAMPVGSA